MPKKITKSKYNLSSEEQKACHSIIHTASASAAAVGAGLAQLPLADNVIITPIQVTMIISLGKVFEQEITQTVAKGLLGGFIANFVGRGVAQVAFGFLPGIGNVSNAVTAATITESIGWLCVDHFYKEKYLYYGSNKVEERENTYSQMQSEENDEEIRKKDMLKSRALEFITGEKRARDNREEYLGLLNELDNIFQEYPDDRELYELHAAFIKAQNN